MRTIGKSKHHISSIQLFNFQSHKESELVLSPGINVITGQSDSGKTSIIRALNWIVWNRPSGDEFVNRKAKSCFAEITLGDGTKIARNKEKDGKINYYVVNGQQLKAIGQDVPKEVSDALNLSEINIQKQFDAPFLISETPGQVAKALNEISHLEDIDIATSNINSSIKQGKDGIELLQRQNEMLNFQLSSLPDIEKLGQKVADIERLDDKEKSLTRELDRLEDAMIEYEDAQKELTERANLYEAMPSIRSRLEQLSALKQTIKDSELLVNRLGALVLAGRKEYFSVKTIQTELQELRAEWKDNKPKECPLCGGDWK